MTAKMFITKKWINILFESHRKLIQQNMEASKSDDIIMEIIKGKSIVTDENIRSDTK